MQPIVENELPNVQYPAGLAVLWSLRGRGCKTPIGAYCMLISKSWTVLSRTWCYFRQLSLGVEFNGYETQCHGLIKGVASGQEGENTRNTLGTTGVLE